MPRITSFPTTYEERKFISLRDLIRWGYLTPGEKSGTITWSRHGEVTSSIGIATTVINGQCAITFFYNWKKQSINYNVSIIEHPSNLGKGKVLYFACPLTGKRCRKLYMINGYFQHRSADKIYYDKQIQSKHYRHLEKVYGPMFEADRIYEVTAKKYFRKFYAGRPTKKWAKMQEVLSRARAINEAGMMRDFINSR